MPLSDERAAWEKWVIGALSTLAILFFTLYINGVNAQMDRQDDELKAQTGRLLGHEQRITTLEESTRNNKELLERIHRDLEDIKRVVVR